MRPRILVTGIPGHYTRLANGAQGLSVSYAERQKQPEAKEEFLQELRNISNTGNYLIGEGALRALAAACEAGSLLASLQFEQKRQRVR